jgi:hypothetical protein
MAQVSTACRQGYVPALHKPGCGNCWAHVPDQHAHYQGLQMCSLGGFAVAVDGWCPNWVPEAKWIDAHPDAASRLGLSGALNSNPPQGATHEGLTR